MRINEVRYEGLDLEDADIVLVAFGSAARALSAPCALPVSIISRWDY